VEGATSPCCCEPSQPGSDQEGGGGFGNQRDAEPDAAVPAGGDELAQARRSDVAWGIPHWSLRCLKRVLVLFVVLSRRLLLQAVASTWRWLLIASCCFVVIGISVSMRGVDEGVRGVFQVFADVREIGSFGLRFAAARAQ